MNDATPPCVARHALPLWLRDLKPTAGARRLLSCRLCHRPLVRALTGWCCGHALHGRLMYDGVLLDALRAAWPEFERRYLARRRKPGAKYLTRRLALLLED